jgi:dihydroorotate dehydrogenase electron transfer subunit
MEPMPLDISTPVTRNVDLGHGNFLIEFEAPERMVGSMDPGQFFMIGVPGAEILLRRPFSVCGLPDTFDDSPPETARVLYKVVGKGTALLASLKPGANIEVLGPLGQGFRVPEDRNAIPIAVAGGIGSAPFPALLARLREAGFEPGMVYGAASAGDLPLLDWFRNRCAWLEAATEDGSTGHRGLVTGPLAGVLDRLDPERVHLYACGPHPMLAEVARIAASRNLRCDVSLEARMACGFGVCLGCVIPTVDGDPANAGFERVCIEGPVMRAEKVAW